MEIAGLGVWTFVKLLEEAVEEWGRRMPMGALESEESDCMRPGLGVGSWAEKSFISTG
jgi:hypothetical protein